MTRLFVDGGPTMVLLVGLFVVLLAATVLRLVLAPERAWPALGLVASGMLVALGVTGSCHDLVTAMTAVRIAPPEHAAVLLEAGQQAALIPSWTGAAMAGALLPLHGWAVVRSRAQRLTLLGRLAVGGGIAVLLLVATAGGLLLLATLELDVLFDVLEGGAELSSGPLFSRAHALVLAGGLTSAGGLFLAMPTAMLGVLAVMAGPPQASSEAD